MRNIIPGGGGGISPQEAAELRARMDAQDELIQSLLTGQPSSTQKTWWQKILNKE